VLSSKVVTVGVGLLFAPGLAEGASLVFEYEGACVFDCEDEGLAPGAPASGRVVIDDAGYAPGGFFGNDDLLDFSFDFGGIRLDKASTKAFSFGGPWQVIPGGDLRWYLDASASVDRFDLGSTISASGGPREGGAYASFLGTCEVDAEFPCSVGFHTAAQFEMKEAAPVPLPPTALLLAAGLAGMAGLRLRRRGLAAA
jgi:hypothetical protein